MGKSTNFSNLIGNTPLHIAAIIGNDEIVSLLTQCRTIDKQSK